MAVLNPFGLRDEEIVLIKDIEENQRGAKCNCVCPLCKEPFEARLGNIRTHHFAHIGNKGCSEEKAYIMGMYILLNEFIKSNEIYLPCVGLVYTLPNYCCIDMEHINNYVKFSSYSKPNYEFKEVYKAQKIKFDSSDIVSDDKKVPKAIIAKTKKDKKLAIRITFPANCCKTIKSNKNRKVDKYENYSTLEINLSLLGAEILQKNKKEIFDYLNKETSIYKWIYTNTSRTKEKYEEIIEESKKHYEEIIEESKKHCEEEERKRKMEERELTCTECHKKKPQYEFWTYRGNEGKCKECEKKIIHYNIH